LKIRKKKGTIMKKMLLLSAFVLVTFLINAQSTEKLVGKWHISPAMEGSVIQQVTILKDTDSFLLIRTKNPEVKYKVIKDTKNGNLSVKIDEIEFIISYNNKSDQMTMKSEKGKLLSYNFERDK
jgi:hypothetical protein